MSAFYKNKLENKNNIKEEEKYLEDTHSESSIFTTSNRGNTNI